MFKLIWKICTFQAKPEEVPYSIPLLLGKISVNLSVLIFILTIATSSLNTALWRSVVLVSIITVFSIVLLKIRGFPERFVQVLSGLLASMAMIMVPLAIPYLIIMVILPEVPSNTLYFTGLSMSTLLLLIMSMWLYVIFARIYRHALEISINQGLLVSLGLFAVGALVFALV